MTITAKNFSNLPVSNGSSRGKWGNFGIEIGVMGAAEFLCSGVSLGVVAVADKIAPNAIKGSSKMLGKLLSPYLDSIENGLSKICKLEECKFDKTKPKEERAEEMGRALIVFGSAFAVSFLAKIGCRKLGNMMFKVGGDHQPIFKTGSSFIDNNFVPSKHDFNVVVFDEGIHLGAMYLLNNKAATYTEHMLQATTKMLEKCGVSKRTAKEVATMAVVWELPNFAGWLAGVGVIAKDTFFKKDIIPSSLINGSHSHTQTVANSVFHGHSKA